MSDETTTALGIAEMPQFDQAAATSTVLRRARELFDRQWRKTARRTDRIFVALMVFQWLGAVVASLALAPTSTGGGQSSSNPHLVIFLTLGVVLTSVPMYLAWKCCRRIGAQEMWSGAMRTAELERINLDVQQQSIELEAAYRSKNAIVETALDAMIAIDRDGRVTAWNPQAELTFGWRSHEILGKPLAEMIIPERFRDPHRNGIARFLATRESHVINRRIEVGALHRQGHEFPVELAIAPICSGDSISFCAFARDITQRVQNADALRAAKEAAESANRAKSAFLANMSHEIRTPLNAILGFTDILVNDVDGDRQQRRGHLQTVYDSGRHLLALIDDVLDLSKIESGGMDVEPVRCSPHEIIGATVSMLRIRAEERGLDLKYFWKSETPEFICTDPDRLRQILMNLIGNAIKFTEVGGVQVVARLETRDSPRLVVDVIDTGIGIEANSLEGIFDPFVQADNSITRRFGGTGLGLSISRHLARLLDGGLCAESQVGRGSVFSLTIPTGPLDGVRRIQLSTTEATPSRSVVAEQPAATLPACRILLVEDGVTNRKLITLILDRAGATTCCAENGQAGVEAAAREAFDVILMDMQMPVMDGYRATSELRRLGCTTPIIALTAHAMTGDEQKCRDAGCSGYLTKPIDARRLLATIADAVSLGTPAADHATAIEPDEPPLLSSLPTDDPEFREIVDEFVVRLEEKVAALTAAWKDGNASLVAEIAHWIKGSGGTVGFGAFTEPAAALEKFAKQGLADRFAEPIDEIESLFRRIPAPARAVG